MNNPTEPVLPTAAQVRNLDAAEAVQLANTMNPPKNMPTNEQNAARFLSERVATTVRLIHELADGIEREAGLSLKDAVAGQGPYAQVAADVIHEITWGVADLHTEMMIRDASDADIAHERGD